MTSDNEVADFSAMMKRLEEIETEIQWLFTSDDVKEKIGWLCDELRCAWEGIVSDQKWTDHYFKKLEKAEEREKILTRALQLIGFNPAIYGEIRTAEMISPEQFAREAREVLSEVRKMRGESE